MTDKDEWVRELRKTGQGSMSRVPEERRPLRRRPLSLEEQRWENEGGSPLPPLQSRERRAS